METERIVMEIIPAASSIFRDFVLLGMLIFMWKIMIERQPDRKDTVFFIAVGIMLIAGDGADIAAILRYPLTGTGIAAYCLYRKRCGIWKVTFMLLLLYNIHTLSFLISDCFYDLLNEKWRNRIDLQQPDYLEQIYLQIAVTSLLLMLVYALLAGMILFLLKRIGGNNFEMGMRDFWFLSVLNIVGIIFSYMMLGLSIVKLDREVFILFDERRDALWKIPLMSALILAGELSSIYVWQKYRLLIKEKENVLIYESRLKQIKERLDEADSFYGNIRALRHDIKNHVSNIMNLNARGDFESVNTYAAKIDQILDEMDYRYSTGNSVCDVVINDKYRVCVGEHISFSSEFTFYDQAGVASFDMGILLGNLLDNAIEACRKVKDRERSIELKSKLKGSFVLLEISNSYEGELIWDKEDSLPVSTKPQMPGQEYAHGIGLRSSRQVAEKYLGNLKIEKTDKTFTVIVMLQMNRPVDTL